MTTVDVGPLILGGNVFGWTADRNDSFAVLDAFVAAGGRAIDTADVYSDWVPGRTGGESETIIGEWLAARPGVREKLNIGTKVFMHSARPGLAPANIRAAIDDSLRRLQTDYVDIYYAHRDDHDVEQADYLAAFDGLVREGKVRAIGISQFSAERIASAVSITQAENLTPITYSQDEYNLVSRAIEHGSLPVIADAGIVEVPFFSLAAGFLTGKYRPGHSVESARLNRVNPHLENPRSVAVLDLLDDIAAAHAVPVAAVSLAWLRAQPTVAAPLASARTVEQLSALVASFELELSDAEVETLSAATAPVAA